MAGKRTAAQKAAVNLRMKSLDATVHDFGKTGMIGNFLHRDTGRFDGLGRTTSRQDFNTLFMKGFGKFDQTGLVGNRDQRARNTSSHRVRFQKIVSDEGTGPIDDISAHKRNRSVWLRVGKTGLLMNENRCFSFWPTHDQ